MPLRVENALLRHKICGLPANRQGTGHSIRSNQLGGTKYDEHLAKIGCNSVSANPRRGTFGR
jgi:hypothetical protein